MLDIDTCPFCGEEATDYAIAEGPHQYSYTSYSIECKHCEIKIERTTKEQCIKDWNRRTP